MDVAAAQTTWTAPTVLVPLFVSLVALGGVVWANFYTAKKNRDHEDVRHQNALKAEDKRHQNSLDFHQTVKIREMRFDAYVRLLTAARDTAQASQEYIGNDSESIDLWLSQYTRRNPKLAEARERLAIVVAEVEIVGSREIVDSAIRLKNHVTHMGLSGHIVEFQKDTETYDKMRLAYKVAQKNIETLRNQIRKEAGFETIPETET